MKADIYEINWVFLNEKGNAVKTYSARAFDETNFAFLLDNMHHALESDGWLVKTIKRIRNPSTRTTTLTYKYVKGAEENVESGNLPG